MNKDTFSLVYGAVLHIGALIALVVLVALSKVSWTEAGPIIGGLVGVGVGVPLTFAVVKNDPVVKEPAAPVVVVPPAA